MAARGIHPRSTRSDASSTSAPRTPRRSRARLRSRTAASRPGDNLYTDSVVALDIDTGKLRWYHQVTTHDLFDRDQVHVMVARLPGGRDVVISAGKSGEVVGLDARDRAGRSGNEPSVRTSTTPTRRCTGRRTSTRARTAACSRRPRRPTASCTSPPTTRPPSYRPTSRRTSAASSVPTTGEVVAIDATTGRVVWDTKVPGDPLGGATVVNDLVFTALLDGNVVALDRDTGKIVWKHDGRRWHQRLDVGRRRHPLRSGGELPAAEAPRAPAAGFVTAVSTP